MDNTIRRHEQIDNPYELISETIRRCRKHAERLRGVSEVTASAEWNWRESESGPNQGIAQVDLSRPLNVAFRLTA